MPSGSTAGRAERLNLHCHCIEVERPLLEASLAESLGDDQLARSLAGTDQFLFSSSPVFVGSGHLEVMQSVVDALRRLAELPAFGHLVTERLRAAGLAVDTGSVAQTPALLGVDFHITDEGPRLIEVNTNPGGVLLALHLQRAQKACCEAVERRERPLASPQEVEQAFVDMARATVRRESRGFRANGQAPRIAIVDENVSRQHLYPEFRLYRELFRRHRLEADVADVDRLEFSSGQLLLDGAPVDGVYNRSTDFDFSTPSTMALRRAWESGAIGVTPDPWSWSCFADKRNLVLLSDDGLLRDLGLGAEDRNLLQEVVPATEIVTAASFDTLWSRRKSLFFKPVQGHGSKGAYDGRKISRRKLDELVASASTQPFVAQQRVPPSERTLLVDQQEQRLKLDVRCVSWRGRTLMLVGRLYRGQTTNMRTAGGGLATAFVA